MEDKIQGITWRNMYQTFEDMFSEVDDLISQETVSYVNNQLQAMGDNVKQFYSEFLLEMFPPSPEDKVGSQIVAPVQVSESSKVSDIPENGDHSENKSSCNNPSERLKEKLYLKTNSSSSSFDGSVKSISISLPTEQSADAGMVEKLKVTVKTDPVDKCSNTQLPGSKVSHENHETVMDSLPEFTARSSKNVHECKFMVETVEKSSNLVRATSDNLGSVSSSSSITSAGCYKNKVSNKGLVVAEASDNSFVGTDSSSAEQARVANHSTGSTNKAVQLGDKKFDESCIIVDISELYPDSQETAENYASENDVQRTIEGVDLEGPNVVSDYFSARAAVKKSNSPEFCESDWEII